MYIYFTHSMPRSLAHNDIFINVCRLFIHSDLCICVSQCATWIKLFYIYIFWRGNLVVVGNAFVFGQLCDNVSIIVRVSYACKCECVSCCFFFLFQRTFVVSTSNWIDSLLSNHLFSYVTFKHRQSAILVIRNRENHKKIRLISMHQSHELKSHSIFSLFLYFT